MLENIPYTNNSWFDTAISQKLRDGPDFIYNLKDVSTFGTFLVWFRPRSGLLEIIWCCQSNGISALRKKQ